MRSKLFRERPEKIKTDKDRWVRIVPVEDDAYHLYDLLQEVYLGRILFDRENNWVYDGGVLNVYEQEDIAGKISGNQKEMDQLLKSLNL